MRIAKTYIKEIGYIPFGKEVKRMDSLKEKAICSNCKVFQKTKLMQERAVVCETARACGGCLKDKVIELADNTIQTIYEMLKGFKERLMADCGQGKSYEAGNYACEVDKIMARLEELQKE